MHLLCIRECVPYVLENAPLMYKRMAPYVLLENAPLMYKRMRPSCIIVCAPYAPLMYKRMCPLCTRECGPRECSPRECGPYVLENMALVFIYWGSIWVFHLCGRALQKKERRVPEWFFFHWFYSGKKGPSFKCATKTCVSGYISSSDLLSTRAI